MKASRTKRSITKLRRDKGRTFFILFLLGALVAGGIYATRGDSALFSVIDSVDAQWTGDVTLGGFLEDGVLYTSKIDSDFPADAAVPRWDGDVIKTNLDGPPRYWAPPNFNPDQPSNVEDYPDLEDYPTAKPGFKVEIIDNMRHIDVDGNVLPGGVPSVVAQDNGYLVEAYYYTFSIGLTIYAVPTVQHDFYIFNTLGNVWSGLRFWEIDPLEGLYFLTDVSINAVNESIIETGSDLATYGGTMWRFYTPNGVQVPTSTVEENFRTHTYAWNRDFFLAGGDSGAGLNLYDRIDEDTNRFTAGFVRVGLPGYDYSTGLQILNNDQQTEFYTVEMAIPLRLTVLLTYDIPYTAMQDDYNYGEDSDVNDDYWFNDVGGALQDLNMGESGETFIPADMLYPVVIVVCLVGAFVMKPRD